MSARNDDVAPNWRTSSYSDQTNCVEVADNTGDIRVRDTKDRAGHVLTLPRPSWADFLAACRRGDFEV